jgi:glutamine synthetase
VKGVPLAAFERAAAWGVGATPVFDAFGADDSIADTPAANPAGDLRLLPDLDRVVPLATPLGWAWAPANRWTQDGRPHPGCARLLLARQVDRLGEAGCTARAAFEVEWVLYADDRPATSGPAYGLARLTEVAEFAAELLRALAAQHVSVEQLHPEYAPGQFELSVAAADPVTAADTAVLVRSTIRAVAQRFGLAVSFAPSVDPAGVGNGGHLHLSLHRAGRPLFAGGDRRFGLTGEAEAFAAGVLHRLPALLALGAPSAASYLRLKPSRWAGAYACWGHENREAALRLVTGSAGERERAANLELKCVDQAANPYLLLAGALAAGIAGMHKDARLPDPVSVNPASLPKGSVPRLPADLTAATKAFAASKVLATAFGPELTETIIAVRRAEAARFAGADPAAIVAATKWAW